MDQINKNDQLFREKLDQLEFQPSDQAWEKVRGSITSQSSTNWSMYFKVAAGVALILTFGLLFYPSQDGVRVAIEDITSPQPLEIATIDITVKPTPIRSELKQNKKTAIDSKPAQEKVKEVTETPVQTLREPLELDMIADIQVGTDPVTSDDLIVNEATETAVKITYFTARNTDTIENTDNEITQDSVKTNLFDKMKFFAKNVSPVELLTDLRTAKEELIENGFKRN